MKPSALVGIVIVSLPPTVIKELFTFIFIEGIVASVLNLTMILLVRIPFSYLAVTVLSVPSETRYLYGAISVGKELFSVGTGGDAKKNEGICVIELIGEYVAAV